MSKGDRSQPTRATLIQSALELLGRDEYLADLGLRREHVAQQAGFARNTLDYHFPTTAKLVGSLIQEHRRQMLDIVGEQSGRYELGNELAASIGPDVLRTILKAALADDLKTYLPGPSDPAAVGRERLYWMCVALADRSPKEGEPDIAAEVGGSNDQTQQAYASAYRGIADILGRVPVPVTGDGDEDFARVQRIIKCFLEGYIIHRRLDMPTDEDDVIDGFLALFYSLTKPLEHAGHQ